MAILENPKISFRENRKLVFLIILAVLIALAVVVVGGFFLYKKYHDTAPVPRKSGYARAGKDGLGASLMDDAQQVEIGSSHP